MVQHSKTALVTGASRGIGRATALALAETGAHVLVHYGRSAREAQSVVESIHSNGGRADGQTWEIQREQPYWQRKFDPSSASNWMCSCPTLVSRRLQRSGITP